jgi:protein SCO1
MCGNMDSFRPRTSVLLAVILALIATSSLTPAQQVRPKPDGCHGWKLQKLVSDIAVIDQDGRKLNFYADLIKDKTVAINLVCTTCTTIDPPLGATFARVQREMGERVGRDVYLISISVDPQTDNPERLKAWGAKFHAGAGWKFITGDKAEIDRLLKALGMGLMNSKEEHTTDILVGSDRTECWRRMYGLARPNVTIQALNDAAGPPPSSN